MTRKLLVGLIGEGIQASLSPALHEEEAAQHGLRLHYQLIELAQASSDAEGLARLLEAARRIGFAGVNVTHPFKQSVVPLLDELSDDARAIGAVNTVVFEDDQARGFNTDCSGFAAAFQRDMAGAKLGEVVVLGAGGAGAAAAHAAMQLGVERLWLVDADPPRAERLAAALARSYAGREAAAAPELAAALATADGLIHATPTGMRSHPGLPVAETLLRPDLWVAEIVYFPIETELLRVARLRGCRTCDGGGMAVWQAAGAFKLFTGVEPRPERMEAHFRRLLSAAARI